jgi:hypothetical protein
VILSPLVFPGEREKEGGRERERKREGGRERERESIYFKKE